ncbi:MAG: M23 family metallopeptidase [Peptostreptococcales bacterium]|jgi:murein DD-endopeptidase MepM/ murein hydrolase activator NlpD
MENNFQDETLNNYIEPSETIDDSSIEIDEKLKSILDCDDSLERTKQSKQKSKRKKTYTRGIKQSFSVIFVKIKNKLSIVKDKAIHIKEKGSQLKIGQVRQAHIQKIKNLDHIREKIKKINIRGMGYKKSITMGLIGLAVLIGAIAFNHSITYYKVVYGGTEVALVKDKKSVMYILDMVYGKLGTIHGTDIVINENSIQFQKTKKLSAKTTSEDEILEYFSYINNIELKCYALYVDGERVATLSSKNKTEELIEDLKNQFLNLKDENIKYENVYFLESIEIKEENATLANINDYKTALDYILRGTDEEKIHEVKKGENYWTIAQKYNVDSADLEKANPMVNPDKLQIGQEISLIVPKPLVTVVTKEKQTIIENIPFEYDYQNTAALYKGEQEVKSKGTKGEREVLAEVEKHNGIEVSRVELNSKVLSKPKTQVVLVGTKELPPLIGTGSFDNPVRGSLTSRFGTRWGRAHTGIDIGAKTGTDIRAADGGVVTYASRNGDYGLLVKIDHGKKMETYYAHCSKIVVKVGDRVYKGQKIAEVGNTGRSTGPHLHFEIRVNGVVKNPLTYVKY